MKRSSYDDSSVNYKLGHTHYHDVKFTSGSAVDPRYMEWTGDDGLRYRRGMHNLYNNIFDKGTSVYRKGRLWGTWEKI